MSGIQIKDLSFAYEAGGKLILKDINTEIGEGEFVCILGQSGCGKMFMISQIVQFLITQIVQKQLNLVSTIVLFDIAGLFRRYHFIQPIR